MYSNTQVFFNFGTTLRTFLRGSPSIDFGKKLASLPAHILSEGAKLTESSIKHMFSKHAFSTNSIVQVFHEDHIGYITKGMCKFKVEIFTSVINRVVKSCNLNELFLVILRPFLFSTQSALHASFAGTLRYPQTRLAISARFAFE